MAKQTTIRLVDDIDGSEAEHALEFAVDGVTYEIDLSEANHAEFTAGIEKFVKAARKKTASRGRGRQGAAPQRTTRSDTTEIRNWAQERGIPVAPRGRIPRSVQEEFQAAREAGQV